jgi:hypothetical protein
LVGQSMATIIAFWQLPGEEAEFFRFLARKSDVVGIRLMQAVPTTDEIRAQPIAAFMNRPDTTRLYLTLASVFPPTHFRTWQSNQPGERVLYSLPEDFPAIIYDCGVESDGNVSQSHACAYPSSAPREVAAWMRRVFDWLRRATPHWFEYEGYRATPAAARYSMSGLNLVPYHGWTGRRTGRNSFTTKRRKRRT